MAGLQGWRNWAPMALGETWLLVGGAWFATTGELVDSDASGEAGSGLRLATWAMLAITVAAPGGHHPAVAAVRTGARSSAGASP